VVTIVLVVKKKQSPEKEKEKEKERARIKLGDMWIPMAPWPAFFIFLFKNVQQQIFDNFVNINNIIKSHCPSIKDATTTKLFVI